MDNPEKLERLGTQDTRRRQAMRKTQNKTKLKVKTKHNTENQKKIHNHFEGSSCDKVFISFFKFSAS
jgi:hypothetical protein